IWKAFEGNTRDLDSGKNRDKIATLLEDTEDLAYSTWRQRHKSLWG
ncbi:hypothetical protein Tco_0436886, partial [Tanacetum coccineum]